MVINKHSLRILALCIALACGAVHANPPAQQPVVIVQNSSSWTPYLLAGGAVFAVYKWIKHQHRRDLAETEQRLRNQIQGVDNRLGHVETEVTQANKNITTVNSNVKIAHNDLAKRCSAIQRTLSPRTQPAPYPIFQPLEHAAPNNNQRHNNVGLVAEHRTVTDAVVSTLGDFFRSVHSMMVSIF